MSKPTVGLIGTGIMGEPMARNLLRAGYSLHIHNRTRLKARKLLQEGAVWDDSPAALASRVDVGRFPDELDDLVNVRDRQNQPFEDVRTLPRLLQPKGRTPADDLHAVIDKIPDALLERHRLGQPVDHDAVDRLDV